VFADHINLFGRPLHIYDKNYVLNKIEINKFVTSVYTQSNYSQLALMYLFRVT
jgi:hypothetical protein